MAVGDILELVIQTNDVVTNDRWVNVLHWIVNTDDATDPNEMSLGTIAGTFIKDQIRPQWNLRVQLTQVQVQRVFPLPRTAGFIYTAGLPNAGLIAGDMLPPQCAAVIRKRTVFVGRRFRGRTFVMGMSESDQSAGRWSGAVWTTMMNSYDSLLTNLLVGTGGGEYSPIIWPKNGTSSGDAKLVTSTVRDGVVRSQRRREVGVGV